MLCDWCKKTIFTLQKTHTLNILAEMEIRQKGRTIKKQSKGERSWSTQSRMKHDEAFLLTLWAQNNRFPYSCVFLIVLQAGWLQFVHLTPLISTGWKLSNRVELFSDDDVKGVCVCRKCKCGYTLI